MLCWAGKCRQENKINVVELQMSVIGIKIFCGNPLLQVLTSLLLVLDYLFHFSEGFGEKGNGG